MATHKASAALLLLLLLSYSLGTSYCRSRGKHAPSDGVLRDFNMKETVNSQKRVALRYDEARVAAKARVHVVYVDASSIFASFLVHFRASGILKTDFYSRSKTVMCKYLSHFKVSPVAIIYLEELLNAEGKIKEENA